MAQKDKNVTVSSPTLNQNKNVLGRFFDSGCGFEYFRERTSDFSLKYQAIRSSAVFGTRRKAFLCGEGLVWVPNLRSFLKLREVGVSPYLGFTLYLSVFQCFGWFEALNGRLIDSKTWDRIIGNF